MRTTEIVRLGPAVMLISLVLSGCGASAAQTKALLRGDAMRAIGPHGPIHLPFAPSAKQRADAKVSVNGTRATVTFDLGSGRARGYYKVIFRNVNGVWHDLNPALQRELRTQNTSALSQSLEG